MFEIVIKLLKIIFFCTFLTQRRGAGVHKSLSRIVPLPIEGEQDSLNFSVSFLIMGREIPQSVPQTKKYQNGSSSGTLSLIGHDIQGEPYHITLEISIYFCILEGLLLKFYKEMQVVSQRTRSVPPPPPIKNVHIVDEESYIHPNSTGSLA